LSNWSQGHDNFIFYGVKIDLYQGQGIWLSQGVAHPPGAFRDFAFVNVLFMRQLGLNHLSSGGAPMSQLDKCDVFHALFWHVTIWRQQWVERTISSEGNPITIENFSIMGSNWDRWNGSAIIFDDSYSAHNHFNNYEIGSQSSGIYGSDATWGEPDDGDPDCYPFCEPGYADGSNNDLHPTANSPLNNRVQTLLVPIDVDGNERTAPTAAGAYRGFGE